MKRLFTLGMLMLFTALATAQTDTDKLKSISEATKGMKKFEGFFDFYWNAKQGKIWLEIERWDEEFLYLNSLPAGIGSNDIGLDRGQLGNTRIVKFQRVGPKVLMIQPNYSFRAITDNAAEQLSVEQAFAQSTIWGFQVAAEQDGRVLVDATDFYLRDAHDVVGSLKNMEQGAYRLEPSRSAVYLEHTKNFPDNSEVEVTLTFVGDNPGRYVRQVVPTPEAITVRQRHAFIRLPDDKYEPRKFDPRAGFFGIRYQDYATPIAEPLMKRFIARHRLQKKDPNAEMSEPVEPIVYYVDRGAPEPIRSALIEGAQWWNQAFEAIGYKNALQVKVLPQDVDPMDVRYNVIQWVHRSTRGWSYGSSVIDPRTGEIIKGHVSLGSLRVRQDFLIATGLLAPYETGEPVPPTMQEMALARLRQLSAHEVGHTLGLTHNFAASVAHRASVMDYPHPYVQINEDGTFDLSEAYDVGIGEWDNVAIAYGYQKFPEATEASQLDQILQDSFSEGLIFIADQDARPAGGAHPLAHLWDNGTDAADELLRILDIRELALERFSEKNIRMRAPHATLEAALVPIYLFHRYQVDAASKLLGGLYYTYALRGDGQTVTEIVAAEEQRHALEALLETLKPERLAVPERLLKIIPPRAYGYQRDRETFRIRTGVTFDPLAAAETAANMTVEFILHPARAARLVEYHARDAAYPGLTDVIDKLLAVTWKSESETGYRGEVRRVVEQVVLYNMMALAANDHASNQVRAIAALKLDELKTWLEAQLRTGDSSERAHAYFAAAQIEKFQQEPGNWDFSRPVEPPAGSPIGMRSGSISWRCE